MLRRSTQLLLSSEIQWFEGLARSDLGFPLCSLLNPYLGLTTAGPGKDLARNIKGNPKSDLARPSNHRISELKRSWADLRSIG